MNCVLCGVRKPRRHCPGVHGDICTVCCGTEREQSIDCPLECIHLQEAHEHEKPADFDPDALPNSDIEVTEEFVLENQFLLALLGTAVHEGALASPGCTDYDVREGLEALVKTYRTLNAGIYYESVPMNPFAAEIVKSVKNRLELLKRMEIEANGSTSTRDVTVLGVLAYLQILEYAHNNGRRRSRAFIDMLAAFYPDPDDDQNDEESLEPDSPRIIL